MSKIHLFGASGSGTTTLGKALAQKLGCVHLDTDDYFWEKTDPPFQVVRSTPKRLELLENDLNSISDYVLSGSLCGWGDPLISRFDLAVFVWIPKEIRIQRLMEREKQRHGDRILPSGDMFKIYTDFMSWASKYDDGDSNMRSKARHEEWISELSCKCLRIEGDIEINLKRDQVIEALLN